MIDPNQAVIPDAKVTVSNAATGLIRETRTNEAGQYRFGALDPGTYELRAEAPGFAAATVRDVVVTVGSSVLVNLNVSLQATVETVDVSSSMISVTESNTSQVLDIQAIQNLPINGRRFQDFATLTPTVQANDNTRGQLSFAGQRGHQHGRIASAHRFPLSTPERFKDRGLRCEHDHSSRAIPFRPQLGIRLIF